MVSSFEESFAVSVDCIWLVVYSKSVRIFRTLFILSRFLLQQEGQVAFAVFFDTNSVRFAH
jgi:hypothetical protein